MKFRLLKINKFDSDTNEVISYKIESKAHMFAKWKHVYDTKDLAKAAHLYDACVKRGSTKIVVDISKCVKE